ncbi:MAG: flagellar biosynthesis protein FlhB [Clostridiales bacterium]|nr:flagellar biosynthesis protein FlhB [Clostridiales bacterium]
MADAVELRLSINIRINLRFFDEKTEKATPRKRKKSREEGQVAKSQEVGTAFLFLGAFAMFKIFAGWIYDRVINIFGYGLGLIRDTDMVLDVNFIQGYIPFLFTETLTIAMPIFAAAMIIGIVTNLVQVGWQITPKSIQPKFSKINPLSGFKRMFSAQLFVTLAKSLLKFAVIVIVIYTALRDELGMLIHLPFMGLMESVMYIGNLIVSLGIKVGAWFLFVAAADYAYTRLKHSKDLRMSKQEVKEEFKQAEGNPQVKGKIRSIMRDVSMRRMMESVPHADVIITNPTHYAVALRYDRESERAPVVLAKGADYIARRIKQIAAEKGIQTVENKELARTLYNTVDIGREIPPELYQAVAEILAFVYRLRGRI